MEQSQAARLIDDLAADIYQAMDDAAAAAGDEVNAETMAGARYLAGRLAMKGWRRLSI